MSLTPLSWLLAGDASGTSVSGATLERRNAPVFLIGCHRSGTTLLRYLLDSHPRIACPPESKFIAGFESFLTYPQALRALDTLGISLDQVLSEFGGMTSRLLTAFARAHGKERWVDKTPNYYRLLPLIDRMFQRQVLYLFIVRHPLDTIDSLGRIPAFTAERPEDPEIAAVLSRYGRGRTAWARYWLEVNEHLSRFQAVASDRCLTVRYEDVIDEPARVVGTMLDFIGEEIAPGMIDRAFLEQHALGYGDPLVRTAVGIHKRSVGKWTSWVSTDVAEAWDVVHELAQQFGYSVTD